MAVDPATHAIVAETLTENNEHDAGQVEPLLDQAPDDVETFYGDGAYDQRKVYNTLADRGINVIVPPRKNAKIWQHGNTGGDPLPRDESLRTIRRVGRKEWKKDIGYHRRSLGETAMWRMKSAFGEKLKNRKFANQQTESALRCKILNLFVTIGMPAFLWS